MISNNPAEGQASQPSPTQAGPAQTSVPLIDPWGRIEVASGGSGPVNDPSAKDKQPPCV
jgi:hypothetical protein